MTSRLAELLSKVEAATTPREGTRPLAYAIPTEIDFVSLDALQDEKQTSGDYSPVSSEDSWRIIHAVVDWFYREIEVTVERADGSTEIAATTYAYPLILAPSSRSAGAWLSGGGPARAWPNPCYITSNYQDALAYAGDLLTGLTNERSAFHNEIARSADDVSGTPDQG